MSDDALIYCPSCPHPERPVPVGAPFFPFCSRECRDRDLARWVEEKYRIPGPRAAEDGRERTIENEGER